MSKPDDPELGRRGNMVLRKETQSDGQTPTGCFYWWFFCPGCRHAHYFRTGTPTDPNDKRPLWTRSGTDESPTFAPSLKLSYQDPETKKAVVACHLFLKSGQLQLLTDCSHDMAGKTVPLPEPPEWL